MRRRPTYPTNQLRSWGTIRQRSDLENMERLELDVLALISEQVHHHLEIGLVRDVARHHIEVRSVEEDLAEEFE